MKHEAGWLKKKKKKNNPVITRDVIKYNCIKPYEPSVPEKGHRETEQTQIRRHRTRRVIRNDIVCLKEIIFEIESK